MIPKCNNCPCLFFDPASDRPPCAELIDEKHALTARLDEAEAKHLKAFEDCLEIVRKANARQAAMQRKCKAAEELGAKIVLDTIADTGFFGITGEYGDQRKRDAFVHAVLTKKGGVR